MSDEAAIDLSECTCVYSDRDHDGPYDYHLVEFYEHPSGDWVRVNESNHIDGDGPRRSQTRLTAGEAAAQIEAAGEAARRRPEPTPPAESASDTATAVGMLLLALVLVGAVIAALIAKLG